MSPRASSTTTKKATAGAVAVLGQKFEGKDPAPTPLELQAAAIPEPFRIVVGPGPKNSSTDPATGLRFYEWQGRLLPSVTSIRRLAGVPFGLHNWTINQVIDYTLDHIAGLALQIGQRKPEMLAMARHELRGAATAKRDEAAKLGTAVHDAAAEGKALTDVSPEVAPRLRQYLDWLNASGATILASEYQVWNLTIGYAGTVDLLVRFPNGEIYLLDLKTGKSTYPEHAMQCLAYLMAEFAGNDGRIDDRITGLHRQIAGIGILHLADDHCVFQRLKLDPDTWIAFRGLLAFALWVAANPRIDSLVLAEWRSEPAA